MDYTTILWGVVALTLWIVIIYVNVLKNPLGWITPTCLFGGGLLMFYIVPSLYWQFRPWHYDIYHYFEGLPLVLIAATIFSFPFLIDIFNNSSYPRFERNQKKSIFQETTFRKFWWLLLIPICTGVLLRIQLFTLGWQGRLKHEVPLLLNSASLALIFRNFATYFPICYFALTWLGDKKHKQFGIIAWGIDGLLRIYSMHRYEILLFVFHSIIYMHLMQLKISKMVWIGIAIFCSLVIVIFGYSHYFAYKIMSPEQNYLSIKQVTEIITITSKNYFQKDDHTPEFGSKESNIILKTIDDFMYRLYDARSESAVMKSIPQKIPYYYGKTFVHILYAFIPRYFYVDKPNLREIHFITTKVMKSDSGINPLGTMAEFYLNFGFFGVFLGGIICFFLCRWGDMMILKYKKSSWNIALICTFPFLADLYWAANFNFTQRLCEGLRAILVAFLMLIIFLFIIKIIKNKKRQLIKPFLNKSKRPKLY